MRTPGAACTECIRSKRKCDRQTPRCTRCVKQGIHCEQQRFRAWKLSGPKSSSATRKKGRTPKDHGRLTGNDLAASGSSSGSLSAESFETISNHQSAGSNQIPSGTPPTREVDFAIIPPTHSNINLVSGEVATPHQAEHVHTSTHITLLSRPSSLPPDVKASPAKTLLWQYFVTVSSRQFRCWEGSEAMGFDDPLGSLLLAMATFNGPLRSAALAFSATEYARAQPSRSPLQSTASLYHKALRMLTSTRGSFPLDAHSLLPPIAASLLLFRVEGVDQASSVRLLALARSAASCAQSLDREGRQNDSRWSILMALLKWTDICTVNSLFSQGPSVVEACVRFPFYEEETMNFSNEFRDWIIHPIYTFSRYLISPLLRIGRLVQLRKQGAGWSAEMETEAEALEELLLQSYDRDVEASKSRPAEDPDQVLRVNEAMHAATSVMYYTRVRDVPFTATFIRRSVARVQQEAAAVDCDSLSSRALVFPLFVAGCEAVDEGVRGLITRRILASKRYPELQAPKIVDHLRRIWAIRDAEPGLSWLEWSVKAAAVLEPLLIF